jgi:hypothetical protein
MGMSRSWNFSGTVSRKIYSLTGLIAFLIKAILDHLVAFHYFHRPWSLFSYWVPLTPASRIASLSHPDAQFLATMVAFALPFILLGVMMTVWRLRDAGEPVWLAVLFFVPFVNLALFMTLCLLPSRSHDLARESAPWPRVRPLDGLIPRSELGSALLSIAVTAALGMTLMLLGTQVLRSYGWGLFVALPFCLGLFSVLVASYHVPRSLPTCLAVSLLPVGILALGLILVAVEGLICILMAAPLAGGLALLGGLIGYSIQARYWRHSRSPVFLSMAIFLVPACFGMEHAAALEPPTFVVRSAVDIDAPPEVVWRQVVAFAQIPPPQEMLFRAGIAYPIRAEIIGHGAGAERHCIFSTGAFVEPIEVWNEPHLLRFSVKDSPAPLVELTPYTHIEPPHLHGYFVSKQGQFLLTALPGGKTHLEGTTWYQHTMWPSSYWHLWSDYIIHRIHMRVLTHIRAAAQEQTR